LWEEGEVLGKKQKKTVKILEKQTLIIMKFSELTASCFASFINKFLTTRSSSLYNIFRPCLVVAGRSLLNLAAVNKELLRAAIADD